MRLIIQRGRRARYEGKKGKKNTKYAEFKTPRKKLFSFNNIIVNRFKSACFQFYRKIYWKVFARLPIENSIGKCDVYGGSSFREARKERKDGLFSAQSVRGIQRATQRALFSPADNTSGIPREFKQIARSRDYYWKSAAEDVVQTTSRFAGTVTPTRRFTYHQDSCSVSFPKFQELILRSFSTLRARLRNYTISSTFRIKLDGASRRSSNRNSRGIAVGRHHRVFRFSLVDTSWLPFHGRNLSKV